jgi:hypothetical protein
LSGLGVRVRQFEASDLEAIDSFYGTRAGEFLPTPDIDQVFEAGQDGLLFVVDDLRDGQLHAIAGLFPLAECRTADGREVQVFELAGAALNGPTVGGLRPHTLQEVLLWLRTVALARSEHRNACVMSTVVDANAPSLNALTRSGLVATEAPGWLISVRRSWCSRNLGAVTDLVLSPAAVCDHARNLTALFSAPRLSRRHRDTSVEETCHLQFDVGWLRSLPPQVVRLVEGDAPDWESTLPPVRLVGQAPDWVEFRGAAPDQTR